MTAIWPERSLRSPLSGAVLQRDGDVLHADGEQWPVIHDIPFLRADRQPLAMEAVQALHQDNAEQALVLLLGDQDGWAKTPPPDESSRRAIVRGVATATFRQAMGALAFGPVATYFEHRWSDPTFLSGLGLAEAHWNTPRRVFELACGAGHFLREFAREADDVAGGDLVFAKLWLARHFVAPDAKLVCFDAAAPWPLATDSADLVFCHDAFYFLDDKPHVAAEMRRIAPAGTILVGHAHNAGADNLSSGAPLFPAEYAALFGGARFYDDYELTQALVEARAPRSGTSDELARVAAISLAVGEAPRAISGGLAMPAPNAELRLNPLYVDGRISWPSERYEREYGPLATYPDRLDPSSGRTDEAEARRRVYVDLPPRW